MGGPSGIGAKVFVPWLAQEGSGGYQKAVSSVEQFFLFALRRNGGAQEFPCGGPVH